MARQRKPKRDIYQEVTDVFIEALEEGTKPWIRRWRTSATGYGLPFNGVTGRHYHGINMFLLAIKAGAKGYTRDRWCTFKQAQSKGGRVRKGEKATLVIFWKQVLMDDIDPNTGQPRRDSKGKARKKRIPILKHFNVFNVDQIDELPDSVRGADPEPDPEGLDESQRIATADAFFAACGADVSHGGGRAFYQPATDRIQMPEFAAFEDAPSYYATLAHEHGHWTGAKSREDRDLSGRFGSDAYAMEELIAEMSAAFTCAELNVRNVDRDAMGDHVSYLANWLKVLKGDRKAIFTAASRAKKAHAYLIGLQPETAAEPADATA